MIINCLTTNLAPYNEIRDGRGRCGRRERSISGRKLDSSNHRVRNGNDLTLYWKPVGNYIDHTGDAKTELPNDWIVIEDDLRWPNLFNLRDRKSVV